MEEGRGDEGSEGHQDLVGVGVQQPYGVGTPVYVPWRLKVLLLGGDSQSFSLG